MRRLQRVALVFGGLVLSLVAGCGGGGSTASSAGGAAGSTPTPVSSINSALGLPNRLVVGLGAGNSISDMTAQGVKPDIIDTYLVGVGAGAWPTYNAPSGEYVTNVMNANAAYGSVSMFTLYQMAANGDGNISGINDTNFMSQYWAQAKLMFQMIGAQNVPALVNLEPDFWGYVQLKAPSGDPSQLPAQVTITPECASQPNTVVGIAACLLTLGHTYAPKAKIGFPPSFFGESATSVGNFMVAAGAANADFIVAQTSDRDAGCMEVASPPPECSGRGSGPFYWDENNVNLPNFHQSESDWSTVSSIMKKLPILFWQTPLGVPSTTPGGATNHYRDDHVDYMLSHANEYVGVGVFAFIFSGGASSQTNITTDDGEFKNSLSQYLKNPVTYPN